MRRDKPGTKADSTNDSAEGRRLHALSVLLQSDNQSTSVVLSITMAMTLAMLAYLGVSLSLLGNGEVTAAIALALPFPVLLLQLYQNVLALSVLPRAASALYLESQILEYIADDSAGESARSEEPRRDGSSNYSASPAAPTPLIGSRASEPVINVTWILADHQPGKASRLYLAGFPYLGLYLAGIVYTSYVLHWAASSWDGSPQQSWQYVVGLVGYSFLWTGFVAGTLTHLLAVPTSAVWVTSISGLGVFLQSWQVEDPTPAWSYFTVISAVLAGLSIAARDLFQNTDGTKGPKPDAGAHAPDEPSRLEIVAGVSVGYVLLSGLVYFAVILPSVGLPQDPASGAASFVLHVALPLVALFYSARNDTRRAKYLRLALGTVGLLAYLIYLYVLVKAEWASVPYDFLDVPTFGLSQTIGVIVVLGLVCGAIEWFWPAASRIMARRGAARVVGASQS